MYLPFVDHIIEHMSTRFPEMMDGVCTAMLLIPSNISQLTTTNIEEIGAVYSDDVNPEQLKLEVIYFTIFMILIKYSYNAVYYNI